MNKLETFTAQLQITRDSLATSKKLICSLKQPLLTFSNNLNSEIAYIHFIGAWWRRLFYLYGVIS